MQNDRESGRIGWKSSPACVRGPATCPLCYFLSLSDKDFVVGTAYQTKDMVSRSLSVSDSTKTKWLARNAPIKGGFDCILKMAIKYTWIRWHIRLDEDSMGFPWIWWISPNGWYPRYLFLWVFDVWAEPSFGRTWPGPTRRPQGGTGNNINRCYFR